MTWFVTKNVDNKEKLVNINDVDCIYIAQADGKNSENDPYFVFGEIGSNFVHLHAGTQVECMRYYEKLKDFLKPVEFDIWE